MAAPESIYYTPDGCIDQPYNLVFDASKLTDGSNPAPLVQPIITTDADFILRAILGVPTCIDTAANGGGFNLFNMSGSQAFSQAYSPFVKHYPVVPEKLYPRAGGVIKFQLAKVLRANTPCATGGAIYYSQIVFQGVSRYYPNLPNYRPGSPAMPPPFNPDDFFLRPYTYIVNLNLSWFAWTAGGLAQIPRTFTVEIQDYAFELHQLSVINKATGLAPTTELCQILLYDASGSRSLSSAPVNLGILNAARTDYSPVFPVPPVVYPVWTNIKFDVTSLVCNSDGSSPYSLQLAFVGVQRVPKMQTTPSTPTNVVTVGQAA